MNDLCKLVLIPLIVLALQLSGCSTGQSTAMTLAAMDEGSGFGGTGIIRYSDDEGDSGFGGTGIIGNIEAFGSIWVNGIEIDYDEDVAIQSNLEGDDQRLKLGQSVILETDTELNQQNRPTTGLITVYYPIAGKIQKIEQGKLLINDEWVQLSENTRVDDGLMLAVGEYIAINAVKNDQQQWLASRLNHNPLNQVIKQSLVEVEFSDHVQQVVLDERLQYLQTLWRSQHNFISRMHKSRIPREVWNSRHRFEPKNLSDRPPVNGMKPQNMPRQFDDIRNIPRMMNHLPPRGIRRDQFQPPRR